MTTFPTTRWNLGNAVATTCDPPEGPANFLAIADASPSRDSRPADLKPNDDWCPPSSFFQDVLPLAPPADLKDIK